MKAKLKQKHKNKAWRRSTGSINTPSQIIHRLSLYNTDSIDNIVCMLQVKSELNFKRRHLYQDLISQLPGHKEPKTQDENELRQKKIKQHMKDYVDSSSLHGLSYIFDKRHPIRRVVWFIITVAAFGYSMQKVYESTVNHFSYPFSTSRMRIYVDELQFPAVSFCNLNDLKLSILNGTKVDEAILNHTKMAQVPLEEWRNVTQGSKHGVEEMLISCKFNGQPCSVKNFTHFNWMQGDLCFTFNSGKPGHEILKVTGAGIERGLHLILDIQHYDYYRDRMNAGIHLILHGQDETPVRLRGPMIPPGFTSYIQIEKKKILNLKAPYKTKCGEIDLKYFKKYSKHTCWLEQLTDYVYEKCSCKDFFMPGDIPVCSLNKTFHCVWPEWEKFQKGKKYDCPLSCEIDSYSPGTMSRALFPSREYSKYMSSVLQNHSHVKKIVEDVADDVRFSRDNLVSLKLYYDDLSYEQLEQQPSYDTLVWLGDIGGQIGLFIGAGAMSYFEFIDCLGLMIYAKFFESFKPKPHDV